MMAKVESVVLVVGTLLSLSVLSFADVSDSKLTIVDYPDCDRYEICQEKVRNGSSNSSFPNVVYAQSVNANNGSDVLHFVFSTVKGMGVLVLHTEGKGATLNFDWNRILQSENFTDMSGGISFGNSSVIVKYSYAVLFTRLFEYNDENDNADITTYNSTLWKNRTFSDFRWMNTTYVSQENGTAFVIFNTTCPQGREISCNDTDEFNTTGGYLSFKFSFNHEKEHKGGLPNLPYSANLTQFDLELNQYVPSFNYSRFAVEVVVISLSPGEQTFIEETKSIDDEYSPGVFRMVNWYSRKEHRSEGGFMQWRPVCYFDENRGRDAASKVQHYNIANITDNKDAQELLNSSFLHAYYGQSLTGETVLNIVITTISYGMPKDGTYIKNNYTSWTASIGYGQPPVESVSLLVIIVIAAGLGIPVVIIFLGGIYVCIKRRRDLAYSKLESVNSYPQVDSN